MQKRENVSTLDDLYNLEANTQIPKTIANELKISVENAKQLHLNMLIYTIGIGTIFSITTPGIALNEIYAQQEIAYKAFLKQALDYGMQ